MAEEEVNEQKMDFALALAQVLKDARANDCLARGLREVCKAVESKKAAFVIVAESCDDDKYKKCVEALCDDCQINRIKVPDSKQLGQWCGLVRTDQENNVVEVVKCSSCAVLNTIPDSVTESTAFRMVIDSMRKKK
eukprot:UN02185